MLNKQDVRVLIIDLTTKEASITSRPDLNRWLGGSGLATALLTEHLLPGEAPLAEEQPVIFASGPMTSLFPVVTKVVAMFCSPLTGELGESHAGMRVGMAMRQSDYAAIVIKGRSSEPTYLVVNSHGVEFKPAGPLWGMDTEECGRILREQEAGSGYRSCLRIGRAGETLVRFAGVNVDTYRHFGRLGLGAVFGSKLLKAIVIQGDGGEMPVTSPQEYNRVYREIFQKVINTEVMEKYHDLGTAGNVLALNEMKSLPTRNLQESQFASAREISGEEFAKHTLLRKLACTGCPVGCIHLGLLRRAFDTSSHEYEYSQIAYDHELIYSLGSLLGIADRAELLSLIQAVERAGLDAMSTGVALAWATEAFEKGLLTENELHTVLAFGSVRGYLTAIDKLCKQETPFYREMALGTEALAKRYGGRDFALTLGGNEVAGYHTGYANIAGQALGARHSHLDNGGYSFDQEKEKVPMDKLADKLINEEIERNALTSLSICLFARKVYDFPTVVKALQAIGLDWDEAALKDLGTKVFLQKRAIKEQLGFEPTSVRIPKRFFQTPSFNGMLEADKLKELMTVYQSKTEALFADQLLN